MKSFLTGLISLIFLFGTTWAQENNVPENYPYQESLSVLQEKLNLENVEPAAPVTEAEFLQMVLTYQAQALTETDCDIKVSNASLKPVVCTAQELGIYTDEPDGSYNPAQKLTIAKASEILHKAYDLEIDDYDADIWYSPYALKLGTMKVIPPSVNSFARALGKGEIAEMLWRLEHPPEEQTLSDSYDSVADYEQLQAKKENQELGILYHTYGDIVELEHKKKLESDAEAFADEIINRYNFELDPRIERAEFIDRETEKAIRAIVKYSGLFHSENQMIMPCLHSYQDTKYFVLPFQKVFFTDQFNAENLEAVPLPGFPEHCASVFKDANGVYISQITGEREIEFTEAEIIDPATFKAIHPFGLYEDKNGRYLLRNAQLHKLLTSFDLSTLKGWPSHRYPKKQLEKTHNYYQVGEASPELISQPFPSLFSDENQVYLVSDFKIVPQPEMDPATLAFKGQFFLAGEGKRFHEQNFFELFLDKNAVYFLKDEVISPVDIDLATFKVAEGDHTFQDKSQTYVVKNQQLLTQEVAAVTPEAVPERTSKTTQEQKIIQAQNDMMAETRPRYGVYILIGGIMILIMLGGLWFWLQKK